MGLTRFAAVAALLTLHACTLQPAAAHDIYTGLWNQAHTMPCCGGESAGASRDCWRTTYREAGDDFELRTMQGDWVRVPRDRIQFTPIPGDGPVEDHEAHLCYNGDPSVVANFHRIGSGDGLLKTDSGREIRFYCAIVPPGGA